MANVMPQLTRLQLGASRQRYCPSQYFNDICPIQFLTLQRISLQRSVLASLSCPKHHVLALGDRHEMVSNVSYTSGPIFQVAYAYRGNLFVAVNEEGIVGIYHVDTKEWKTRWMGHENAVFDVIWTHDDKHIVTAAGDLEIRVWNVESGNTNPFLTFQGHDMSVKCVRQARENEHIFASGGRDGKILLWDIRTKGTPKLAIENVHAEQEMTRNVSSSFMSSTLKRRRLTSNYLTSSRSVTCVEFGRNEYEIFSAGAVDTVVKCWDIRRINRIKKKEMSRPVYEFSCSSQKGARRGISSLKLLATQHGTSRLLVNVLNDSVAVLDLGVNARNCQPKTILRCVGHRTTSFYSKATFSTEGNFIAAASGDGLVYVWDAHLRTLYDQTLNLSNSSDKSIRRLPCLALKGHENEVNGIAWNPQDLTQLVSCSDDGTVRCWQVDGERLEHSKMTQFQLETSHENDSENYNTTHWTNWNDFILQPDGYAYRIQRHSVPKLSSSVNHLADRSLRATHYETTSHLSSIHTLGELKEKQQSDRHFEPRSSRMKLRRKTKSIKLSKQGQRTLVELWRTNEQANSIE